MDSTDGTGATLAWPLVRAAAALLSEVAEGEDPGPSQPGGLDGLPGERLQRRRLTTTHARQRAMLDCGAPGGDEAGAESTAWRLRQATCGGSSARTAAAQCRDRRRARRSPFAACGRRQGAGGRRRQRRQLERHLRAGARRTPERAPRACTACSTRSPSIGAPTA